MKYLSCSAVLFFVAKMQHAFFFPLRKMRPEVFKNEMAKRHSAFNKHDKLGS